MKTLIAIFAVCFMALFVMGVNSYLNARHEYAPIKTALSQLDPTLEHPEKFLNSNQEGFDKLFAMIKRHKGELPLDKRGEVRGISHAHGIIYLGFENDGYQWVAPWEEVKDWR